jgi:anti-sigma regulatory factor (Ser/Thr protein kinase)
MMQFLDGLVSETPDLMVTCCCILVEPMGELTICSAGHLPVLQVEAGGAVSVLPVRPGIPLGVGGIPHQQIRHTVRPGSVLVLYTDGLVEDRRADIETQIDRLIGEVQAAAERCLPLEESADILLSRMLPDRSPEDDMTLLLARVPPPPLATTSKILSSGVGAVPAGRRFLSSTLHLWGIAKVDDTARLLVSELLSNAVRHGLGPLALRIRRTARELTVEVTDHSMRLPQARLAGPDDESGRGLGLVDTLSSSWGTTPNDDGKTVWFTLAL